MSDAHIAGRIFDIQRFAIHDGPGIRTTVFLKGCPLRCAWCQNPESISLEGEVFFTPSRCGLCGACVKACRHGAQRIEDGRRVYDRARCVRCGACVKACLSEALELAGRDATVGEVLDVVERDRPFYDTSGGGATLSGGEPLMQPEFAAAFLREAKRRDLHTCLDTTGYAPWSVLEGVRPHTDLFLYDVKLLDDGEHRRFTGVGNGEILDNLRRLVAAGANVVLRCPIIPTVNDSPEHLARLAGFVRGLDPSPPCNVLPYHHLAASKYERLGRVYPLAELKTAPEESARAWVEQLNSLGVKTSLG